MQTLVLESPFADTLIRDNHRYYVFTGKPNPEILTADYFDRLASSRDFFARKMDETSSAELLDSVESRLLM